MKKPRAKSDTGVPPQLLGVMDDVLEIDAKGFRLEYIPQRVMASFWEGTQAVEIDFEILAGEEMIRYLLAETTQWKGKRGVLRLVYEGNVYNCSVETDSRKNPSWVQVAWA